MKIDFQYFIRTSLFLITLFGSFVPLAVSYADPLIKRALIVESMVEQEVSLKTLREKLITSRALGLYLQNLLPAKGNVYGHSYEHLNDLNLELFKEAQKNSSEYMGKVLWLPLGKKNKIRSDELSKDKERKAIFDYFVNWTASIKVLHFINLTLKNSILVEPLEKTLVAEKLTKFDRAYKLQEGFVSEYEKQLLTHYESAHQIQEAKSKIFVQVAGRILQMMIPHLDLIKNSDNSVAVDRFVSEIEKIQVIDISDKEKLKVKIGQIFNKDDLGFQKVEKAFSGIELPSSNDIDGSDESFEVVTRLEVGYDLLKNILLSLKKN